MIVMKKSDKKEIKLLIDDATDVLVVTAVGITRKTTYINTQTFELSESKDKICEMDDFKKR